jgi:hypothetical protein
MILAITKSHVVIFSSLTAALLALKYIWKAAEKSWKKMHKTNAHQQEE